MDDTEPKLPIVKFSVKLGKDLNPAFFGKKDQMLQDAMKGIIDIMPSFSFTDYILFAEIEKHPEKLVAIPPSILCGWIKNDSCIHIEKINKACQPLTGNPKDWCIDQETLFFIKTDDRSYKDAITEIHCEKYKYRELCVSVIHGDSFEESLKKDGRFVNVESFQIFNEEGGTSPALNIPAQYFHNDVFSVSVKRNRKRKSSGGTCNPAPLNRNPNDNNLQDQGRYQRIIKEKAVEENGFPLPFSAPSLKFPPYNISNIVLKIAKSKVFEMLLSPEAMTNKKKRDQAICHLVEENFSKKFKARRPTWSLEILSSVSKSVGRIFCGHKTGTCFLLFKNIIITNLHVFHDLRNEMKNSTGQMKIKVRFNHIRPNQVDDLREVIVKKVILCSVDFQLDYVFLRITHDLDDLEELCLRIRCKVPDDGSLTIIGHPDGQEKVEETCRIVSTYLWRDEALRRIQKRRPPVPGFDKYLFSCKEEAMSVGYDKKIAYDTSFFDGASGSPCINNDGHIVGMHTRGYVVKEMEQSVSIMEFGVSFKAIYADVKQRYGPELARKLFPKAELDLPSPMRME